LIALIQDARSEIGEQGIGGADPEAFGGYKVTNGAFKGVCHV
jgi:hypothetical protein